MSAFSDVPTPSNADAPYDASAHLRDDESRMLAAADLKQREFEQGKIRAIDIFKIAPDVSQPRRAIPFSVRKYWDGQPYSLSALFDTWRLLAEQEIKSPISLFDLVLSDTGTADEDDDADTLSSPILDALMRLVRLAVSIRREGLNNAITLYEYEADRQFIIETGERRWLAFHLLHTLLGQDDTKWLKIPSRVTTVFSRWRQAGENNARESLNAIGRARQLALLLMDLLGSSYSFASLDDIYEQGMTERSYYAQVADGTQFRIPHGKTDLLLKAMALSNPSQIRQYRAILRLPDDVWVQADDENWTEGRIRDMLSALDSVTTVTESPTKVSAPLNDPALKTGKFVFSPAARHAIKTLIAVRSGVSGATPTTHELLDQMIDEAERALKELKRLYRKG